MSKLVTMVAAGFYRAPVRRFRFFGFALLLITGSLIVIGSPADAHGAQTRPGSRTYLCRIDGTHASGDIQPSNPACGAAVALGGKQPLWDWFGVLRSDGGGRTRGYIPDGQLCSGGEPKYAGYDLARADWPYTSLSSGADLTVRYNAWAAHPGEFRLYVTKDGYDPAQPLTWDDLEDQPFSVYNQDSPNGNDAENGTPDYQWNVVLPAKTGQHIIYSVWSRSDSEETFYGCSDVRFDGGSGEVFGVGAGANPVGAPESTSAPATTTAPTSANTPQTPAVAPESPAATPESTVPTADGSSASTSIPMVQTPDAADPASNATLAIDQGAAVRPVLAGASADTGQATDGQLQQPTGGGISLTFGLILALLTFGLGFVAALALTYEKRVKRLEHRLAGYDYARPQPTWDRLDPNSDEPAIKPVENRSGADLINR